LTQGVRRCPRRSTGAKYQRSPRLRGRSFQRPAEPSDIRVVAYQPAARANHGIDRTQLSGRALD
jgi:hypothetical protein